MGKKMESYNHEFYALSQLSLACKYFITIPEFKHGAWKNSMQDEN